MCKKIIIFFLYIILISSPLFSDNIRIAQIDASRLLINQTVQVYVSVTDEQGKPVEGLTADSFTVYESADGRDFTEIPRITGFKPQANSMDGINFLLLIDNSGSMYDTLSGKPTEDKAKMRITHAQNAVRAFLSSMTNPRDKVGLVSYNTFYTLHSKPIKDKVKITGYLDSIERPLPEKAYTEMYAGLYLAVEEFQALGGRKVIVILSDGENYPYAVHAQKDHEVFKHRIFKYTEPIAQAQQEGVSIFAVNFSKERDKNLKSIAIETGGAVYDAFNQEELKKVYQKIQNQVVNEYLISYRATMDPAPHERKYVKVTHKRGPDTISATRFYFSGTVFGIPLRQFTPLLIIPLALALLLLWVISRLKFEKKKGPASLEVLHSDIGSSSTRVLCLDSPKTIIGGSDKAGLTIAGAPAVREIHATVIFDEKRKSYKIEAQAEITVNNQPVKTKLLEAGDVINVGGTTIVFDDGKVE